MQIGERIKIARHELGYSQIKLAEISGVSQQMISKLERGVSQKTADVVTLAIALKVRPRWLEVGEKPRNEIDHNFLSKPVNRYTTLAGELSPEEQIFLELYRKLSNKGKNVLCREARTILNYEDAEYHVHPEPLNKGVIK